MRGGVVAATLVLLSLPAAVPVAHAGSKPPTVAPSMTVTASPHVAGAHAVRLTVNLRYEMQCDYPGAGPLVVTFPSALKPPEHFADGVVRLGGKPVAATTRGRRVTVRVPPHRGVLCNLIGPGSVTLTFTRAARLANPRRPGSYRFEAAHAGHAFAARLAIKPAS